LCPFPAPLPLGAGLGAWGLAPFQLEPPVEEVKGRGGEGKESGERRGFPGLPLEGQVSFRPGGKEGGLKEGLPLLLEDQGWPSRVKPRFTFFPGVGQSNPL